MRSRPLDLYKRLPLYRCLDDVKIDIVEGEKPDIGQVGQVNRKKLNIPTCDVHEDPDYGKNLSPDFTTPQSYVRHQKKLPGDIDIAIDYVIEPDDEEWMITHPRLSTDKEVLRYLDKD